MAGGRSYLAYLVRLWAVSQDDGVVWRASVEDAHTGERRAFADLAGAVCVPGGDGGRPFGPGV